MAIFSTNYATHSSELEELLEVSVLAQKNPHTETHNGRTGISPSLQSKRKYIKKSESVIFVSARGAWSLEPTG